MLFMVIERFRDNDMVPVYKKLRDTGRMIPEGLTYIDSWVEPNFSRCSNSWTATTYACSRNGCSSGEALAPRLTSFRWFLVRRHGTWWRHTSMSR
jgi:hypothetical protein